LIVNARIPLLTRRNITFRLISIAFSGMKNTRPEITAGYFFVSTTLGGLFEYIGACSFMSKMDEPRVNREIVSSSIRLVDQNGAMVGVVTVAEGIRLADQAGLDLVEISPNASPPVCKILDYGKYKYEIQKKAHEARKKQKVIAIKEIKLRPTIDKHDLAIKLRNVMGFLENGDKVRITLRFRGREMDHQDLGMQVLERVQESLKDHCRIEQPPKMEGKQIVMTVVPK
jgi:translation initiation factor IF-3